MFKRNEFIDTETITMYKKLRCERLGYIFYGTCILRVEITLNIISILLLYMDEYIYTVKQPDFKEMLLLNPHHFINMCK